MKNKVKHEAEEAKSVNSSLDTSSRRKLLKSFAVGGGVAATAASMPKEWVKPVLDQVVLPAHAQTSQPDPIVGVFSSGATLGLELPDMRSPTDGFAKQQYELLEALIEPAHASAAAATNFCGNGDDDTGGDSTVFFNILANQTVEVALDSLDRSYPTGICGNTTTIVGSNIADVDIQISTQFISDGPDLPDYFVRFTNMQASETEITGNYQVVGRLGDDDSPPNSDDPVVVISEGSASCSGTFTATSGGMFPAYETMCSDDD